MRGTTEHVHTETAIYMAWRSPNKLSPEQEVDDVDGVKNEVGVYSPPQGHIYPAHDNCLVIKGAKESVIAVTAHVVLVSDEPTAVFIVFLMGISGQSIDRSINQSINQTINQSNQRHV